MKNLIIYVLVLIGISYLFKSIEKESDKKILSNENGKLLLKPASIYGQSGIICLFGSLFFLSPLLGAFGYTFEKIEALEISIIVIAIVGLILTVYFMAYGYKHRILIDHNGVKSFSLWRKPIEVRWEEIQKVTFNGNTLYLNLISNSKTLRVHAHMIGFKQFRELVVEKTHLEIQKKGLPGYSWPMP